MLHFLCLSLNFDHIILLFAVHQTKAYVAHSCDCSILSMPLIIEEGLLTAHLREEFREEVGIYENQLLKCFILLFIICPL